MVVPIFSDLYRILFLIPKYSIKRKKILPVYGVFWRTRLKTLQWRAERTCDRSSPWRGNPCLLPLIDFGLICPSRCITSAYITRLQTVLQCQPPLFGRSMGPRLGRDVTLCLALDSVVSHGSRSIQALGDFLACQRL